MIRQKKQRTKVLPTWQELDSETDYGTGLVSTPNKSFFVDASQYEGEANIFNTEALENRKKELEELQDWQKESERAVFYGEDHKPITIYMGTGAMESWDKAMQETMQGYSIPEESPKKSTRRRGGKGNDLVAAMAMTMMATKATTSVSPLSFLTSAGVTISDEYRWPIITDNNIS